MITLLEYVWIDGKGRTRGKTMVYRKSFDKVTDLPDWNFDGSSCHQAEGFDSDVLIKPVAMFNDPFRGSPHKLVLCDTYTSDGNPHETNTRHTCLKIMDKAKEFEPWFGIEQEWIAFGRNNLPYKWEKHNEPGKGPQGPYYCAVGGDRSFGREVAEEHLQMCLKADIKVSGMNAEVMASQWEYQVGPCEGIEMGDHLWMSRYILHRVSEKYEVEASFHPKPYKGDWNGSGGHTNYSTKQMREGVKDKTGLDFILDACQKLEETHKEHMEVYGKGNEERMTGLHETSSMDDFGWGYSDRGKSIRIPLLVGKEKKGYMEDRRPASSLDPYLVTAKLVETTCL